MRKASLYHLKLHYFPYLIHLILAQVIIIMGPDGPKGCQRSDLPSGSKLSWDSKLPPWNDSRGSQEAYYGSVVLWKQFHDLLPDNNLNMIPRNLQVIILESQLYGRALDLCKKVKQRVLVSENGVRAVAEAIHNSDTVSAVTENYKNSTRS